MPFKDNALPSVGIVGAGVAGAAMACLLRQRGYSCTLFQDESSPQLVVGESLVPAAIPMIRRLGIESEVAAISQIKRGAALRNQSGDRVDFPFKKFGRHAPEYAYNIPRPQFDELVRQRARTLGARLIRYKAAVEQLPNHTSRELQLTTDSLEAAGLSEHPDILIDASGRRRLFGKAVGLSAQRGPRSDVAHFAHFDNFSSDSAIEGQVVITAFECGWSWQIPLREHTSVGVVLNAKAAKRFGASPEVQFEALIECNPLLRNAAKNASRKTPVHTYSNYQLVSERAFGRGWFSVGDAFGFVDPMLSPGVFMALESANLLDQLIFSKPASQPSRAACIRYQDKLLQWHSAWSELIEYFYDGRMLGMGRIRGEILRNSPLVAAKRLPEFVVSRSLAQLVSGVGTCSILHRQILKRSATYLLKDNQLFQADKIAGNRA